MKLIECFTIICKFHESSISDLNNDVCQQNRFLLERPTQTFHLTVEAQNKVKRISSLGRAIEDQTTALLDVNYSKRKTQLQIRFVNKKFNFSS